MNNSDIKIVNNSGNDIQLIHPYVIDFTRTGVINPDIVDLFTLTIIDNNDGLITVVVDDV